MTIKITSVSTSSGEIVLAVAYDNPSGSGTMFSVNVRKEDLFNRLIQIKALLGRPLTLTDARQVLVEIVNEIRVGKTGIPENFDFSPYINLELET